MYQMCSRRAWIDLRLVSKGGAAVEGRSADTELEGVQFGDLKKRHVSEHPVTKVCKLLRKPICLRRRRHKFKAKQRAKDCLVVYWQRWKDVVCPSFYTDPSSIAATGLGTQCAIAGQEIRRPRHLASEACAEVGTAQAVSSTQPARVSPFPVSLASFCRVASLQAVP